jgi:hypothetical protein
MTEPTPDTGTTTPPDTPADTAPDTGTDLAAEVDKWRAQARKHEDRAKANAAAAKELEQLRASMMTDQEKAVAEATAAARAETLVEMGGKLAAAEIRAAAAGRLDDTQLATLIDGIDPARFVTDTGEVDTDRVRTFVDGIAPAATDQPAGVPDIGQGNRSPAHTPLNGDPLLRALNSKLGIR